MNQRATWITFAAWFSASGYILFALWRAGVGFPLDDAWIHQVYARNLGTHGEFAFFASQPSAGSTAPLWTIVLAFGYLLRFEFHVWAYLCGIVLLAASALVAASLAQFFVARFTPHLTRFASLPALLALFLILEWHLAWSAVSGMEILLFVFLSLILLERFYADERAWVIGGIAGLLTLTRPEGAALAALVGGGLAWRARIAHRDPSKSLSPFTWILAFALGFGIILAPYVLFNLAASGAILPNTFYAKAAEYAILFDQTPLIARYAQLLYTPFAGAQILLLPGVLYLAIGLARKREWLALIPLAWVLLLPALYAWRLPVTYQHGRYEMPIIPFIVMYGMWGTAAIISRLRNWVARTTWVLSTGAVLIVFWLLGAAQYATDVSIVECEMVGTAKWIAANAPATAVVAAHDIGALGYFYDQPLIDLAGLVSPQVIPFIRNENRLRDYLFSRQAQYVVVFPDWYPAFDADPRFVPAFQTQCTATRAAGEKNMIVYRIVK